jgi:Tfp pilus assembly protein PilN
VLKKQKKISGSQTTGAGYSFYLLACFVTVLGFLGLVFLGLVFFARRAEPQEKIELCLMVLLFDELPIK